MMLAPRTGRTRSRRAGGVLGPKASERCDAQASSSRMGRKASRGSSLRTIPATPLSHFSFGFKDSGSPLATSSCDRDPCGPGCHRATSSLAGGDSGRDGRRVAFLELSGPLPCPSRCGLRACARAAPKSCPRPLTRGFPIPRYLARAPCVSEEPPDGFGFRTRAAPPSRFALRSCFRPGTRLGLPRRPILPQTPRRTAGSSRPPRGGYEQGRNVRPTCARRRGGRVRSALP